jgi:hypothetical protein
VKKTFIVLFIFVLVLTSCGGKTPEAHEPTPDTPAVSTPPETPVTVSPPAETPVTVVPPSETPVVPEPQPDPDTFQYHAESHLLRTSYYNEVVGVFQTESALKEHFSKMTEEKYGEYFAAYDAAYFGEKTLVVISVIAGIGSPKCDVVSVDMNEQSQLVVDIDVWQAIDSADDASEWTVLLSVDNDAQIENSEEVKMTVHYNYDYSL